jgi:actin
MKWDDQQKCQELDASLFRMDDEGQPLVIDNGSGQCKAGFASDEAPRSVFPSIVGYPKHPEPKSFFNKDTYAGDEAWEKASILILKCPIEHGIVTDWDDMQKIWHRAYYYQLRVDPAEHPVLLTEAPLNPKVNREKLIQIQFEVFDTPACYLGIDAVLSLYGSGRTTAIVLDVGEGVTHTVPIYDGRPLPHAILRVNLGGRALDDWMGRLIYESPIGSQTFVRDNEIYRGAKETLGYVSLNFEDEIQKPHPTIELDSYGDLIGNEPFRCTELLFKPYLNRFKCAGIDQTLFDSITRCDPGIQKQFYEQIVLSGGTTMFKGFPERIEKEIISLAPKGTNVQVIAPAMRKFASWIGGSVLASQDDFPQLVITRKEYDEAGAGIVHQKCP